MRLDSTNAEESLEEEFMEGGNLSSPINCLFNRNNIEILFLGDFFDTLDSRNFTSLHTREKRKKLFIKRIFGHKQKFVRSDSNNFKKWKVNNTLNIIEDLKSHFYLLSDEIINDNDIDIIIDKTKLDLNQNINIPLFSR